MLLEQLVRDAGVPTHPVAVAEPTRESLSVTDIGSGQQFRFVFPGPRLTAPEKHRCLAAVDRTVRGGRYLVASGSLPPGLPVDFYQELADLVGGLGVRLVLDASGSALRHIRTGVHVLKPSVRELAECVGHPLPGRAEQAAAARQLVTSGVSEIVVLSLGAEGALAVTRDMQEWFDAIHVPVRSGIGAGDAMVAGLTVGLDRGLALADAVRLGIAAASAALVTPGTRPGRPERIAELYRSISPNAEPSGIWP